MYRFLMTFHLVAPVRFNRHATAHRAFYLSKYEATSSAAAVVSAFEDASFFGERNGVYSVQTSTREPRRSAWSRINPGPRRSRSSSERWTRSLSKSMPLSLRKENLLVGASRSSQNGID